MPTIPDNPHYPHNDPLASSLVTATKPTVPGKRPPSRSDKDQLASSPFQQPNDSNPKSTSIPRPESRSKEREPGNLPHDNPNPNALHPESQSQSTTSRFTGRDSQGVNERERKNKSDLASTTSTTGQRTSSRSATDHQDNMRSGSGYSSHEDSEKEYAAARTAHREREQSSIQTPRPTRLQVNPGPQRDPSSAQHPRSSNDPHDQHPPGVAEGATTYHYDKSRPMNAEVPPSHHEQLDRMSDINQPSQSPGYTGQIMNTIASMIMPSPNLPPPKDKYELLRDKYRQVKDERNKLYASLDEFHRELKRTNGELRQKTHYVDQLHQERQRMRDSMGGLQNELNIVHRQLEDAKNLSEVRGKELLGAQVFLTKADTLSISEVGEKVAALNEEIFQAAATLGEALIHKRHEVSQTELDAAPALVGELMTSLLISQSQKPEPDVNPFIVQVVLQIFMVKFCVSKIQSWYPGDPSIGGFLTAIYSEIRSSEEQAVSGRWRALTHAHTRPSTDTWQEELYQKLSSVLKVGGWMVRSSEDSFTHRLPPIFKAVNELRVAIGENFTSADLDLAVFDCYATYNPSIMDDAYSDGRQSSGQRAPESIVGTTGIGLHKVVVERNSKLRFQIVIRAKVVLKSTVTEALEPVKPSIFKRSRKVPLSRSVIEGTDGSAHTEGSRGTPKADKMDVTHG